MQHKKNERVTMYITLHISRMVHCSRLKTTVGRQPTLKHQLSIMEVIVKGKRLIGRRWVPSKLGVSLVSMQLLPSTLYWLWAVRKKVKKLHAILFSICEKFGLVAKQDGTQCTKLPNRYRKYRKLQYTMRAWSDGSRYPSTQRGGFMLLGPAMKRLL